MKITNLYSSIFVIISSAILLIWVIPNFTAPPQSPLDIPPDRIPSIAVWVCLISAVLLFMGELRSKSYKEVVEDDEYGSTATGLDRKELVRIAILIASVVAIMLITPLIGLEITMAVVLVVTMHYMEQRNWFIILITALVVPISVSQFAYHIFSVDFP